MQVFTRDAADSQTVNKPNKICDMCGNVSTMQRLTSATVIGVKCPCDLLHAASLPLGWHMGWNGQKICIHVVARRWVSSVVFTIGHSAACNPTPRPQHRRCARSAPRELGCPVERPRVALDVVRACFVRKSRLARNDCRLRKPETLVLATKAGRGEHSEKLDGVDNMSRWSTIL